MTSTTVTFELTDTRYVSVDDVRPGEVVLVQPRHVGIVVGFADNLVVVFVDDASFVERSAVWRVGTAIVDETGVEQ